MGPVDLQWVCHSAGLQDMNNEGTSSMKLNDYCDVVIGWV